MSIQIVKYIGVALLAFAYASVAVAQDFRQDIVALQKEFENMTRLHIVMDVKAYEKGSAARPYFQTHVDIRKQDNRYRYMYGDMEMLMNDNYLIVVNKSERQISMTKRDVKSESEIAKSMHFNLDSMINTIGAVEYRGEINGIRQYTVPASKRSPETDLYVALQSKSIQRIEYHYPDGQLVDIVFNTFNKQPVFAENIFDEANYVNITKGKVTPVSSFKNFTVTTPQ